MTFDDFLLRFQDPHIGTLKKLHEYLVATGANIGDVLRGDTIGAGASVARLQDIALRLQLEKDEQSIELGRVREKLLDVLLLAQRWRHNNAARPENEHSFPGTDGVYVEGHKHGLRDCAEELSTLLNTTTPPKPDLSELRELVRRIDSYGFECDGGPLRNCVEWLGLTAALDRLGAK